MLAIRAIPRDVSIGIVTALPREFAAVCTVLRCHSKIYVSGREYRIGQVATDANDGLHTIAVCCLTHMGNNSAAAATVLMSKDFPRLSDVLMCGIAGAVPSPRKPSTHVRLGDVVVTGEGGVVQYDFTRRKPFRVEIQTRVFNASSRLRQSAIRLRAAEETALRPWLRHIDRALSELMRISSLNSKWLRPGSDRDQLREFEWRRPIDYLMFLGRCIGLRGRFFRYRPIPHPIDNLRHVDEPRIFHGVIASANSLQKSPRYRDRLRDRYNALAIEMEGAGLAEAAYELSVPFFIVRGTCDYCNPDKNDDWQHYAAVAAAGFTLALLEVTALPALFAAPTTPPPIEPEPAAETPTVTEVDSVVVMPASRVSSAEYAAVIVEATMRRVGRIQSSVDNLEYETAKRDASELSEWIAKNRDAHSRDDLRIVFSLLARVAIIKASQVKDGGVTPELSEIENYLAEVRNASSPQ